MLFLKKNRFKPLFKQFIKLRENVQNRKKLLNFKKKKWELSIKFYLNKLKRYRKFKPLDHSKYFVTKFGNKGTSYNKRYRDTLHAGRRFRLHCGGLLRRYFKNQIKYILKQKIKSKNLTNLNYKFLEFFESRLDIVLHRAKFSLSVRSAKQLILHGKVYVNNKQIKNKAYILKNGDLISLDPSCWQIYKISIIDSLSWPIPPKYLIINYKTMQILFLGNIKCTNLSTNFFFNLRLQKILVNYPNQ